MQYALTMAEAICSALTKVYIYSSWTKQKQKGTERQKCNLYDIINNSLYHNQSQTAWNLVITAFTLCLKKVPTFKLSVTLSNLNRFSKFLHCWKPMKFATKLTHLKHVATLPCEIKNLNFVQIFSIYRKMQTNCILLLLTLFSSTSFDILGV